MKPTADQVIEEYDALPLEEKRKVYVTLTQRDSFIVLNQESLNEVTKAKKPNVSARKRPATLRKEESTISQKVLWKDILIGFIPNKYIANYAEIWLLESILGAVIIRNRLRESRVLNADFVEDLFQQAPYVFYLNQAETWLFSDYADLNDTEGGPLKELTAFDALQRYGLKLLEEAKEKQYVRL